MKYVSILTIILVSFSLCVGNCFAQDVRLKPSASERVKNPTSSNTLSRESVIKTVPLTRNENKTVSPLPDLAITKLTASPHTVQSGDKVKLRAEVKNNGDSTISGVLVRFMNGRKKLGEKTISAIGGRSTVTSDISTSINGNGGITIQVLVDPDNKIAESNERNNQKQVQLMLTQPEVAEKIDQSTVGKPFTPVNRIAEGQSVQRLARPAIKPDLIPLNLKLNKRRAVVGESIVAQAVIKNVGRDNIAEVPVAFRVNKKQIGLKEVTISGNSSSPVTFRFIAKETGVQSFSLTVDPEATIDERNEYNNTIQAEFEVTPRQTAIVIDSVPKNDVVKNNTLGRIGRQSVAKGQLDSTLHLSSPLQPQPNIALTKKVQLSTPTTQEDKNKPHDLVCSVATENGFHKGAAGGVVVRVENKGVYRSSSILVGFGLKGKINKSDPATWLGSKRLNTGVLGGQWEYVTIPWQQATLGSPEFIAIVDLLDEAEETDETNNVSNTFQYSSGATGLVVPQPADAFEAFNVLVGNSTGNSKNYVSGEVISISWSLVKAKTLEDQVDLLRLGPKVILGLYDISHKPVMQIAPDVPIGHPGWGWSIPGTIKGGYYYVVVKSQNQLGYGTSEIFHISEPLVAKLKDAGVNDVGITSKTDPDPKKISAINDAPYISYQFAPDKVFQTPPPQGPGWHVSGIYELPFSIYWADRNGDLENGWFRFKYKSLHAGTEDSGWKKNGTDFRGKQGLSQLPLTMRLNLADKSSEIVEYSFALRDEKGHVSNSVTGVVKVYAGQESNLTTTPQTSLATIPEKLSGTDEASIKSLNIDTPSTWTSGMPVTIAWTVPGITGGNPSEVTHDISLLNVTANGACGSTEVEKIVSKLTIIGPSTSRYNQKWTVDPKIVQGQYCLNVDSRYYVLNKTFSGTKKININKYGVQIEPIKKAVYSGEKLLLKWKSNATLNGKGTLYWHSLVDGNDYTLALNVDLQKNYLWQAGSCISTQNGKIPFGSGSIFLQAGSMSAESNAFSVLEPASGFQNLGIEITEPTGITKWRTEVSNVVRWESAASPIDEDIEILLINAKTGAIVLGPYLGKLLDYEMNIIIPKTNNGIPPGVPFRIILKPQGRVSNDADVLSAPFEFQ